MQLLQPGPPSLAGAGRAGALRDAGGGGGGVGGAGGISRTRSEAGLGEGLGAFSLWGPSQLEDRGRDGMGLVSPP